MKQLYLIKALYDGGKSAAIEKELLASKLDFKTLTYTLELLPWSVSAVPCVVVDVDGQLEAVEEQRHNKPYNHASLLKKFKDAPNNKPPLPPPVVEELEIIKLLKSIDQRLAVLEAKI